MAPEMVIFNSKHDADAWVDIWSVGVIFGELVLFSEIWRILIKFS